MSSRAYLLILHDLDTGEIAYDVFSEPTPTLGTNVVSGRVIEAPGDTYGEALDAIREYLTRAHPRGRDILARMTRHRHWMPTNIEVMARAIDDHEP